MIKIQKAPGLIDCPRLMIVLVSSLMLILYIIHSLQYLAWRLHCSQAQLHSEYVPDLHRQPIKGDSALTLQQGTRRQSGCHCPAAFPSRAGRRPWHPLQRASRRQHQSRASAQTASAAGTNRAQSGSPSAPPLSETCPSRTWGPPGPSLQSMQCAC